ncbi:hypothetical protein A2W13_00370 [Candidatus Woesebacteria bacterium RBG_16_36_11]|uniref:Uncharacterized protein n=3 Tax=Candidatus Woeseibacteriota TaxID=1752722 RepID=A0A1F7X937_9BACT|nr:MAG: hypothetical protein A2Z67_00695 [Candidatus Woesebacteria bacterium RBG_13_36_22]OGM10888.1 MAG: hypothetical protein A2W13_00370 [Candidatus Woesebacteria bacterium RBG_16_36_11]OGM16857.1 MAG: hypothetical protein A2V55_02765 [Candidatus Woesebacteria bacterium RBG_19FT_COMBO_37_29]
MSKNTQLKNIMQRIAFDEERRLIKILHIVIFSLGLLIFLIIACTHQTFDSLAGKDFFGLIRNFEMKEEKIFPQIGNLGNCLLEEIVEGVLLFLILSIILFIIILVKSDIISFPKRFKETKKFKG